MREGKPGNTSSRNAKEIRRQCEKVGDMSRKRHEALRRGRRELGFRVQTAKLRPRIMAVRELSGNEAFTGKVLPFPRETAVDVGKVKAGVRDAG